MLQRNCRIKKLNNLKFYEKDILFDDYVFTHNLEIEVNATYITPGFGLALIDSSEGTSLDGNKCILFFIYWPSNCRSDKLQRSGHNSGKYEIQA